MLIPCCLFLNFPWASQSWLGDFGEEEEQEEEKEDRRRERTVGDKEKRLRDRIMSGLGHLGSSPSSAGHKPRRYEVCQALWPSLRRRTLRLGGCNSRAPSVEGVELFEGRRAGFFLSLFSASGYSR